MNNTLLSVDLDWLNGSNHPLKELSNLLKYVSNNIPATMTVQHHEFLPTVSRWIRTGKIPKPFNVINIDQHHDYYLNQPPNHPEGDGINCGMWGFRLPLDWYDRYTWVHGNQPEICDWDKAQEWLLNHGIYSSGRRYHRLHEFKGNIVAAVFCISPDYLYPETGDFIEQIISLVVKHFSLEAVPKLINNDHVLHLSGWGN